MKITIWLRNNPDGSDPTLRLDYKYESYDSPLVQRYGKKLMDAIEGKNRNGKRADND